MKNQAYRMAMLFDFYGDLLTERQREFYDLYYNEDLSLAEIAENYGISRQGVRDVIVRAEASMTEIEDKTHIIRRFQQSRAAIAAIDQAADKLLQSVDRRSYSDAMLDELARTIKENVAKLEQEELLWHLKVSPISCPPCSSACGARAVCPRPM